MSKHRVKPSERVINYQHVNLRGYKVELETPDTLFHLVIEKIGDAFHLPFDQHIFKDVRDKSHLPTKEDVSLRIPINKLPPLQDKEDIVNYLLRMAKIILDKIGIKIKSSDTLEVGLITS